MRILLAAIASAVFFSGSAHAAIYRVDVSGTGNGGFHYESVFDLESGNTSYVPGVLQIDEVPPEYNRSRFLEFLTFSTGQAFHDGFGFFGCSGLLGPLCWGVAFDVTTYPSVFDDAADTFTGYNYWQWGGGAEASNSGLTYNDDGGFLAIIDGKSYSAGPDASNFLTATFTDVEVTVVPGPAPLALLLTGLGAIALTRRGRA